jgi:enoyl-CoA hydratase/carnithine racemase
MGFVEYQTDCGLGIITLADSRNGNRLNRESLTELSNALNKAIMHDEIRVIVLRSNGRNFSLGMDLDFLQSVHGDKSTAEEVVSLYTDLLLKIFESPKPVVALIYGDVKAGGTGLVAACDIVIASDDTTFELSEILLGLIPANVLPFLFSLRIPPQKARYLIMTAKRLSAEEARALNMVDEVYSMDELEKGVKSVIKSLFRAAPFAIAATKDFTRKLLSTTIDKACNIARETLLELIARDDVIAGIQAFNEGSTPAWFAKCKLSAPLIRIDDDTK